MSSTETHSNGPLLNYPIGSLVKVTSKSIASNGMAITHQDGCSTIRVLHDYTLRKLVMRVIDFYESGVIATAIEPSEVLGITGRWAYRHLEKYARPIVCEND